MSGAPSRKVKSQLKLTTFCNLLTSLKKYMFHQQHWIDNSQFKFKTESNNGYLVHQAAK